MPPEAAHAELRPERLTGVLADRSEPRSFGLPLSEIPAELSGWLEVDPVPLLLIGPGGALLEANPAGRRLVEVGAAVSLRGATLVFIDQQAQQSFLKALATVISRRSRSIRLIVRGNDGHWRQMEITGCAPDGRERAYLRFATEPQGTLDLEPLMLAFGLTLAEGEVLRRLLEGLAPKEIARALGMSPNTVRSHLRVLYLKMRVKGIPGVIRQAVRLTR